MSCKYCKAIEEILTHMNHYDYIKDKNVGGEIIVSLPQLQQIYELSKRKGLKKNANKNK